MWIADNWQDYKVLDTSDGEKLERWGKYITPYLYIDDYKYWTMGAPVEETIVMNRAKVTK